MTSTPTAQRLILDRGLTACECCGNELDRCEAHHCLYKKGRKSAKKLLDMDYNLQVVCYSCHHGTGLADSYENRVRFWGTQCYRYTKVVMLNWHKEIPYKPESKEFAYR